MTGIDPYKLREFFGLLPPEQGPQRPVTNPLDFTPEDFQFYLEYEFEGSPSQKEFLLESYRKKNSPWASAYEALDARDRELQDEGRRRGMIAPMTKPEDMTFMEALRAEELEWAVPGMARGMVESTLDATDFPHATMRGPTSEAAGERAAIEMADMVALGPPAYTVAKKGATATGKAVDAAADAALDPVYRRTADAAWNRRLADADHPAAAAGKYQYIPNRQDAEMMFQNPVTPAEMDYVTRINRARELAKKSIGPEEILEETGIMHLPIRKHSTGEIKGIREVAYYNTPEEILELGQHMSKPLKQEIVELPEGVSGQVRTNDPDKYIIQYSNKSSPDELYATSRHEKSHIYSQEADVWPSEVGSSMDIEFDNIFEEHEALSVLREAAWKAGDEDLADELTDTILELLSKTGLESYFDNPGEMLARIAEGDMFSPTRLSFWESVNPRLHIAGKSDLGLLDRLLYAAQVRRNKQEIIGRGPMDLKRSSVSGPYYFEKRGPDPDWWRDLWDKDPWWHKDMNR